MWRDLLTDSIEDADIVVFGIPIDTNCSVGKGASEAPRVLRECSECLPPVTMNGDTLSRKLYDLGDVCEYNYTQVLDKISLCKNHKMTLVLGGDHSVSILSQRAYRQVHKGKRGIIHIDAHADICDFYNGSKFSHACVNRRALENGFAPKDITMLGIRSYEVQETEYLKKNEIDIFSPTEVERIGVEKIVCRLCEKYADYDGIYLSFDIDGVDPAYAPGTGTPEAFGFSSKTVLDLIIGILRRLPIDMMDVVEVSPPLDCNNITSWLALKYILEVINIIQKKEKRNE